MKNSTKSNSKLNPRNLVKHVLSKTSTSSTSGSKISLPVDDKIAQDSSKSNFHSELTLLKNQIESLQNSVAQMQSDNECKERNLAILAKEKEQLTVDLKKQKRSNANLKQQLEDERQYYYKEKEQFCQEINSFRTVKHRTSGQQKETCSESKCKTDRGENSKNSNKKELSELKNTLNQALEANYNLSVKFLRMKNTKLSLSKQLVRMRDKYEISMKRYKEKVECIQKEINDLVKEQFYKPIPPSNKKYLYVIKQNGALMHENMCLQFEIDRLAMDLERFKYLQDKNHTNDKLRYIHSGSLKSSRKKSAKQSSKTPEQDSARISEKILSLKSQSSQTCHQQLSHRSSQCNMEIGKKGQTIALHNENQSDGISSRYELMTLSNSNMNSPCPNSQITSCSTSSDNCKSCDTLRTQSAPEIDRNGIIK